MPHLVRSFTRRFGVSPHAYVIRHSIEAAHHPHPARGRTTEHGHHRRFYDQAHFTQHFKRGGATTAATSTPRFMTGPRHDSRYFIAAMTRRLSSSDGARPSLANTLARCFSTTPIEIVSAPAIAALDRP